MVEGNENDKHQSQTVTEADGDINFGKDSTHFSIISDSDSLDNNESDQEVNRFILLERKRIRAQKTIGQDVDFIINSDKFDLRIKENGRRSRNRLSEEQISVLQLEFQKNMNWNKN